MGWRFCQKYVWNLALYAIAIVPSPEIFIVFHVLFWPCFSWEPCYEMNESFNATNSTADITSSIACGEVHVRLSENIVKNSAWNPNSATWPFLHYAGSKHSEERYPPGGFLSIKAIYCSRWGDGRNDHMHPFKQIRYYIAASPSVTILDPFPHHCICISHHLLRIPPATTSTHSPILLNPFTNIVLSSPSHYEAVQVRHPPSQSSSRSETDGVLSRYAIPHHSTACNLLSSLCIARSWFVLS